MYAIMNNTKWTELQQSMRDLYRINPSWRTKCVTNGYQMPNWDGEWYYHFSENGFEDIEWVEIKVETEEQKKILKDELQKIHLPGHPTEYGFKIYGYIKLGEVINYI